MNGNVRIPYFDNLKGVLIILVVVGHVVYPVSTSPYMFTMGIIDFIYLFHMPLFLFVSGLFARSVFKGGVFKASSVLYYALLSVVLNLLLSLEKCFLGGAFSFNPFSLGGISWYLMVLSFYLGTVPFFISLKPWFAISLSVVVSVVSGYFEIGDTLAMSRAIVFLPFFLVGLYFERNIIVDLLNRLEKACRLSIVRIAAVCSLVAIACVFLLMSSDELSALRSLFSGRISAIVVTNALGWDSFFAPIIARILYYITVVFVSVAVLMVIPRRNCTCLTTIGENSLQVYFFTRLCITLSILIQSPCCFMRYFQVGWRLFLYTFLASQLHICLVWFPALALFWNLQGRRLNELLDSVICRAIEAMAVCRGGLMPVRMPKAFSSIRIANARKGLTSVLARIVVVC